MAKKSGQKLGCSPSVLFAKEKAGSMCGEGDPAGHADGFRNERVTSLCHCEAGRMALPFIWLGSAERDLASGSAGGPARVASLSPAKREVKREARKRGTGVQENQTSLRSLVLSLVVWSFEFIAAFAQSRQPQVVLDICCPLPSPLSPFDTPLPTLTPLQARWRLPSHQRVPKWAAGIFPGR